MGAGPPDRCGAGGRWLRGARPAGGAGRLLVVPPPGRTGNSGLRLLRTGVVWAGLAGAGAGAGLLGRAGLEAITTGLIGAIEGLLAGPGGLVTRAGLKQ